MAYFSYSNLTRQLVEISDFPLSPGDDCSVSEVNISMSELEMLYTWEVESCSFQILPKRIITKLQYMNRFTDSELATIYTMAKTNIAVEIWLEKFKLASEINLDDRRIIDGLHSLELYGLIGVGRTLEILL